MPKAWIQVPSGLGCPSGRTRSALLCKLRALGKDGLFPSLLVLTRYVSKVKKLLLVVP